MKFILVVHNTIAGSIPTQYFDSFNRNKFEVELNFKTGLNSFKGNKILLELISLISSFWLIHFIKLITHLEFFIQHKFFHFIG